MTPTEPTLVLQDQDGTYYAITPALLAQARVPNAEKAALQTALAGPAAVPLTLAPQDDVSGYLVVPSIIAVPIALLVPAGPTALNRASFAGAQASATGSVRL